MFASREDNSGNGEEGGFEELELVAERSLRSPSQSSVPVRFDVGLKWVFYIPGPPQVSESTFHSFIHSFAHLTNA